MVKKAKISDFSQDTANANKGTERGLRQLDDSIANLGLGRSILVDKNNQIIAGNKTQERAIDRGLQDAIVIETDGSQLVVVKRKDLDLSDKSPDNPARRLAYADNAIASHDLDWNTEQILSDLESGMDLSIWFDVSELESLLEDFDPEPENDSEDDTPLGSQDVPDALFPSDNEFGIPTLDLSLQADFVDMPFTRWGKWSRKTKMKGTYHFYEDDYKFEGLWSNPQDIVNSGCVSVVECNFSTSQYMPKAVALWGIYRKRWLSAYWQSFGRRIFVDLNIHEVFQDIALLGVPKGWSAYCIRASQMPLEVLQSWYALALDHAEKKPLFLVYAGGKEIQAWAKENGLHWFGVDANG